MIKTYTVDNAKLVELRNSIGKSQNEIANLMKIPKSTFGMYEQGKRNINAKDLKSICKIYNINKEEIVIEQEEIDKEKKSSLIKYISFNDLKNANLYLDATYKGAGIYGNVKDDPLSKLLGCGNQGGFRKKNIDRKNAKEGDYAYVVIYSDFKQPEWNDSIDYETGEVVYYGDNKNPGYELNEKLGNQILDKVFRDLDHGNRKNIPPFFLFTKGVKGRDVIFRGLVVPGSPYTSSSKENLVSIWSMKDDKRFQNYRAKFTILESQTISRSWINDLLQGDKITVNTPQAYKEWIETGTYKPLKAEKKFRYRKKDEQIPTDDKDIKLIKILHDYFQDPYDFEACACEIFKMMDKNVVEWNLTRRWSDGGRDAVGKYRIGLINNNIEVEFALEAKRYELNSAIKIKETSRLISRLRHRQFGVLVTTSYVHHQAYKEIIDDGHPVVIICANDIIQILKEHSINTEEKLIRWLEEQNYKNYKRI